MSSRDENSGGAQPRRGSLAWFGVLALAVLALGAVGSAASAQGSSECEENATDAGTCTPAETVPKPPPPQDAPPARDPPPKAPPPEAPPPTTPAPVTPCPDGTLPPCPAPEPAERQESVSDPDRDCRKRPGVRRRPKRCPRPRRGERERQRAERRLERKREIRRGAARERRRLAFERRGAERREECESAGFVPAGGFGGQCGAGAERGGVLVGRLASRPLPDPLPPGRRLSEGFAKLLKRTAGSRWPLVLAFLRAKGRTGSAPATAGEVRRLGRRLRERDLGESVQALADYHRAAGLAGLTRGLDAVKGELIDRVLHTAGIAIYGPGRTDVANGSIDVRVLVTMLYLAERQGALTVTSLISGHGVFTKSGNVSLHAYGRAMDIVAVGGTPILGNQQPGGVTETALRGIMLMPPELRPDELISLFDVGGPSFAMADHADHIHVGY